MLLEARDLQKEKPPQWEAQTLQLKKGCNKTQHSQICIYIYIAEGKNLLKSESFIQETISQKWKWNKDIPNK